MALTYRLETRQSQALVMTPQLLQAIKLLQLSNLDVAAFVEDELERNPLLERDSDGEGGHAAPADAGNGTEAPAAPATSEPADDWIEGPLGARTAIEATFDSTLENVFPDEPAEAAARAAQNAAPSVRAEWGGGASGGEDYDLEAFVAADISLTDHLDAQLTLALTAPADRLIGRYLIGLIDEAGYLPADLGDAATRLGAAASDVARVLATIQTFEPAGIAARSLAECLALQLREHDRLDPAMGVLVDHLDLVAKRDFAQLRRLCGADDEDLAEMIGEIRRLDPKPGLRFSAIRTETVVPDIYVRPGPGGGWLVELNSETLPRVLVNHSYSATLSKALRSADDKSYISTCLQNATWLARALDQRARTILKVATEIVRQQDGFFRHGVAHLRPLNLRAIADAVEMHESTVSRATANKYVATTRGSFELKYFFTASIAAAGGGAAHSAEAVRHRIRQMIDGEDAANVLSDDTIVDHLRAAGIDIARRTVAKYREAMRIPSSVQRRRNKQSALVKGHSESAGAGDPHRDGPLA
jgi:RNA polymerase sigma-54 factor